MKAPWLCDFKDEADALKYLHENEELDNTADSGTLYELFDIFVMSLVHNDPHWDFKKYFWSFDDGHEAYRWLREYVLQ